MDKDRDQRPDFIVPVHPEFRTAERQAAKPITDHDLGALADDQLRDLIARANAVLRSRKAERRKQALAEIKRLAKENGLDVSVNNTPRRRGRPPKEAGKL